MAKIADQIETSVVLVLAVKIPQIPSDVTSGSSNKSSWLKFPTIPVVNGWPIKYEFKLPQS